MKILVSFKINIINGVMSLLANWFSQYRCNPEINAEFWKSILTLFLSMF